MALAHNVNTTAVKCAPTTTPVGTSELAELLDFDFGNGDDFATYIDNMSCISTDLTSANRYIAELTPHLASLGLPVEASKMIVPGIGEGSELLGLFWWHDGALSVKPAAALRLFALTTSFL